MRELIEANEENIASFKKLCESHFVEKATDDEAREMIKNLSDFFTILMRWDEEVKQKEEEARGKEGQVSS